MPARQYFDNCRNIASPKRKGNFFIGLPIIFRHRAHARMSCRGSSIVTAGAPSESRLSGHVRDDGFALDGEGNRRLRQRRHVCRGPLRLIRSWGAGADRQRAGRGADVPCAGFRRELVTSELRIQRVLDFLSEPDAQKALPSQFFDDRFVRQVNARR